MDGEVARMERCRGKGREGIDDVVVFV